MPKQPCTSKTGLVLISILSVCAVAGIIAILFRDDPSHPTAGERPPLMRLPRNLLPHSYRVFLQPHPDAQVTQMENGTDANQTLLFVGISIVKFHCVKTTQSVYLHNKDLRITKPPVVMNERRNISMRVSQTVFHKDQSDVMEILLEEPLEMGEDYSLWLNFWGQMSETPGGLYMSSYEEDEGEEGEEEEEEEEDADRVRYIIATHLEPTMARAVFPCFDEPDMKAVFNVTIIHRRNTVALANGQTKGITTKGDWQYSTFHPTPKMSTYLFAFAISEFTSIKSTTHDNVKIYTFARPELTSAGHTQYAADITGKVLKFFEGYFGIDYKQKTLKQIALPDLSVAGMENWGLITYQEDGILYEENVSTQLEKTEIALLIAHEIAHQWFGNLVTMKWWNQIWLNEGFASYMSIIAVDHVEPTFKMTEMFLWTELHSAFDGDVLASSHPLNPPEAEIESAGAIHGLFDDITYSKGARVLKMLADYVGESTFHEGVKKYLSDFSFKNPEQNNLWESIQNAVQESGYNDVATLMDFWTNQSGYPVVMINTSTGEIHQRPFMLNDSSESNVWWQIPIRVISSTSDTSLIKLTSRSAVKRNELISKNREWILANVNCTGYYRVNYDPENWERLQTQLETDLNRIPLMNRGQLIDDAFHLARAKMVDVTLALNLTRFLRKETAVIPWEAALRNLRYFILMLERTEAQGPMQMYLRKQAEGLYDHFSSYTDSCTVPPVQSLQYSQLTGVEVACSNRLPQCLEMASKMFGEWMSNNTNRIHPNLRSRIYCHAVAAGGEQQWEFAWEKVQNSNSSSEKQQLLAALSCTTKVQLLSRYLNYSLDPKKIQLEDVATVISTVAQNVVGYTLAWNFTREHWEYIRKGDFPTVMESLTSRMSTQSELEELESFVEEKKLVASGLMNQAIEQTQVNIRWVDEHKDVVLEWLKRQQQKD